MLVWEIVVVVDVDGRYKHHRTIKCSKWIGLLQYAIAVRCSMALGGDMENGMWNLAAGDCPSPLKFRLLIERKLVAGVRRASTFTPSRLSNEPLTIKESQKSSSVPPMPDASHHPTILAPCLFSLSVCLDSFLCLGMNEFFSL